MDNLLQDLRYAIRMLLKRPGFTLVAVVTLAIGIGANAAIFSVANAVLLRPLPFKDQDRLVAIREIGPRAFQEGAPVTAPDYLFWREHQRSFEHLAALKGQVINLTSYGEPERIGGNAVTANFFPMLGVTPASGRAFLAEDEQPGRERVAIVSHGLWQRKLGSDPETVGKALLLNGNPHTIIGVLPADFQLPTTRAEIWLPLPFTARDAENRGGHMYNVIGKMKSGVSIEEAQADINTLMARLGEEHPQSNAGWTVSLNLLQQEGVGDVRPALMILFGAVAFLLLIACANVANLLLTRAAGRNREFAVRVALGASRFRLARQLFTESLLLTFFGGIAGLLLAIWTIDFFIASGPSDIPRLKEANLDGRVIAFTMGLAALTAFLSGLAPVLKSVKVNLNESLKEGSRGTSRGFWHLRTIMVAEISLALVLLVGAGLLIKSYALLVNVNPGLRTENVLTMNISLPFSQYSEGQRRGAFFQALLARVESLSGVESAAITQNLPLTSSSLFYFLAIEGVPAPPPGEPMLQAESRGISPDYFRTMGIPVIKGRSFNERDTMDAAPVIIVSESLARRYFPGSDPVGKKITILANNNPPREIVGVVADVRHKGLDEEVVDETYTPYLQTPPYTGVLAVHTSSDPMSFVSSIKEQVWAIDKDQPVFRINTMEQLLSASISQRRFNAFLLGVFAGLALLLASIGIYGVISYSVSQSTQEIGIRMALGAGRGDILKLVIGQGMTMVLLGLCIGVPAAYALTRFLENLLFRISPTDPMTFAGVSLLLAVVALLACYIPARRAAKVDPMVALKYE